MRIMNKMHHHYLFKETLANSLTASLEATLAVSSDTLRL